MVFSKGDWDLGQTDTVEHTVDTGNAKPIKQAPRRIGPEQKRAADEIIKDLLDRKLITPSKSSWASNIVMVKKRDGSYRMCVDYRGLNAVTLNKDAYPLPNIDTCLRSIKDAKWICVQDCASGYYQVKMSECSKDKTAFCVPNGLYQWEVLPFGLVSAPACFMRLMEDILSNMNYTSLLVYLDDIILFGSTVEETLSRL